MPPGEYKKSAGYYARAYRIETAFGCLKDWRGAATGAAGDIFLNAIILAAIIIFWI